MARLLDTQEYLDAVCELLRQGERSVTVPVAGGSMTPFLINGDTVYLDLPGTPVKRGDIVLYTREGGRYILHRVYKVNPDGSFLMVGDAQMELEYLSNTDCVRACVTSAAHKGKRNCPGQLRWWAYSHLWRWLLPFRHRLMHVREKLRH
jgi:SOS-response transcriptional repressor LexA